jgi:hypothetical protein
MLTLRCCARPQLEAGGKLGPEVSIDLALRLDLLPYTVPELRRLLWRLVWTHPPEPERVLAWSV